MGRQVNVQLGELTKAGCTIIPRIFPKEVYPEGEYDPSFITVVTPQGRSINSHCIDMLCFDCRHIDSSSNGWFEYWMLENNVQYVAG